jgi:SAM-dependent methyltransferase
MRDGSAATSQREQKSRVRRFWEGAPCGSGHATAPEGTPQYFAQVERRRDELEPFIAGYADFTGARGERTLEIGVGLGSDHVKFARAGAVLTGVDLTERAVELVRRRLELERLESDLRVADAEQLPFPDAAFDRVYSWGVLHHTPDTSRAVAEAIRVLRPGGTLCVMLYARHSWTAYGMWVRHALLARRPFRSLSDVLAEHMESEGTKGFTPREVRRLFAPLEELRVEHVGTPYDRRFAGPLAVPTGRRLGWFLVIRGRRPAA